MAVPEILGFVAEGCREIGRKANRLGLGRRLAAQDLERRQALARLGQAAWQSKIDLTESADLRARLEQLDSRAGDLSVTAARLDAERTALEARRQAEVSRFDALLATARTDQSDADAALRTARAAQTGKDQAIRTPVDDEVATRAAESQRLSAEVARIDAERKAALQPIDSELTRVQRESAGATRDQSAVTRDQAERFGELGNALYERRLANPLLTDSVQAIAAVDVARAATQAAIDGSLALTSAMPRGTMAKFWSVVVLVPGLLAAAYGVYANRAPSELNARSSTPTTTGATATGVRASNQTAEEQQKDEAVAAFLQARSDASRREKAVPILEADALALGSSADRTLMPMLITILERGEPELRAAAANAVGMIGPTAAEIPLLVKALNDPMPGVRDAAQRALGKVSEPRIALLVKRASDALTDHSRTGVDLFAPTVAPDAARLGMPLYPGATFLAYASDLGSGRIAFASDEPVQTVVDFYAATARGGPPAGGEEFTRAYFRGTPDDPTGMRAQATDTEEWFKRSMAAGKPTDELQAEADRRGRLMMNLPLVRYGDGTIYGAPVFIASEITKASGSTRVLRYVAVFQDLSTERTGFDIYIPVEAARK